MNILYNSANATESLIILMYFNIIRFKIENKNFVNKKTKSRLH